MLIVLFTDVKICMHYDVFSYAIYLLLLLQWKSQFAILCLEHVYMYVYTLYVSVAPVMQ